jgi:hypothetical protein
MKDFGPPLRKHSTELRSRIDRDRDCARCPQCYTARPMRRACVLIALCAITSACERTPTLEEQLRGEWFLRVPPTYRSVEQLHFVIRDGVIVRPTNGVAWGRYVILDDTTIRLAVTNYQTRQPVDRLLTVRVMPDGSMSWNPPDHQKDPAFILTRQNDDAIAAR